MQEKEESRGEEEEEEDEDEDGCSSDSPADNSKFPFHVRLHTSVARIRSCTAPMLSHGEELVGSAAIISGSGKGGGWGGA